MKALAFLDLLGFSRMVNSNRERAYIVLNDFYNISFDVIRNEPGINGHLFSDSLLAYSDNPAVLVNSIAKIYRRCLMKNDEYEIADLSKYFLLPRGGVSFGIVELQNRTEAPNLTKNFIISPALVHSAKIESQIKGSRLLIADSNVVTSQVFNWNQNVRSNLYENRAYTFWSDSIYFDSLWFYDNQSSDNSHENVESLIRISLKLIRANKSNLTALEQHINTLRIGLLSYSRVLPTNNKQFVYDIIEEFRDDKYWLIWLSIIEMIMNSPDSWAYESDSILISFYNEINLKLGWSNIVKEINKPRNETLKDLFAEFQNRISLANINIR